MGGYVLLPRILGALIAIALKIWAYSGLVLISCFVLYYFYGGLLAFIVFVFAITGILYHAEDNFLFYPELPPHSRVFVPVPSMYGLPYENVQYRTTDGVLIHMFFIHQPADTKHKVPTLVFLHGNAGNMGHRLQNAVGIYYSLNCNILLVEYRGYGLSEGTPSEEGLYMDARASIDYLYTRTDINLSEIIVFGRSLGGAVAIDLACRAEYTTKIWCLIVENTFTSIPDMAKVLLRWRLLQYFPLVFYKNKFVSIFKVLQLQIPTLFISGLADTLVPPKMMSDLHNRCGSPCKQLVQLADGTHNETWILKGYYNAMVTFVNNCRLINKENGQHSKDSFSIEIKNIFSNVHTI